MTYPDLRGALFKVQRKDADAQPDYFGRVQVNGLTYRIAGWLATPKRGGPAHKYISLALTLEDPAAKEVKKPARRSGTGSHRPD